jgi:glyoxylase-like metal-dependent hydrolase (beta-lactamase superfamily II)
LLHIDHWGPVTRLSLSRTMLGRPLFWVNAYAVEGLLIDTGPYGTRREVVAAARQYAVRQVFITHQHEDHCGAAGALYRELGLMPQTGAATVPFLKHPPLIHLYRHVIWGSAQVAPAQAVTTTDTEHYHWEVLPTPGHSPDHTALYEPRQGWVFSGDLFVHERAKYLRADEDLAALERSLRYVADLDPTALFCGHAGVIEQPRVAILRKLQFWDGLRAQARDLKLRGRSLSDIRTAVLGPEGRTTRFTQGHLSKLNLTRALLVER